MGTAIKKLRARVSPRVGRYDDMYDTMIEICLPVDMWQYCLYHESYSRVIVLFPRDLAQYGERAM